MYNSILLRDEEYSDLFHYFPDGQDQGYDLKILDSSPPLLYANGRSHEISYLFAICQDQETRTVLFEWLEEQCLLLFESAWVEHNWSKCEALIKMLAEADFSSKIMTRKRKTVSP